MKKVSCCEKYFEDIPKVETEEGYQEFIEFAFRYADSFCLSVYKNQKMKNLEDFRETKWGYLYDSIIDYECTNHSPVTLGSDVLLIYFKINAITKEFLKKKKTIYDFRDSIGSGTDYNWLWDLCFIKDGKLFFVSCTHEQFCSIDKAVSELFHKERTKV